MWKQLSRRYWRWRVRSILESHCPDVLHDFILPAANGGLAKIYHAVLSGGGILFSLLGFRTAMDLAGEARQPQRTVPRAMALGLGISLAIYLLLSDRVEHAFLR